MNLKQYNMKIVYEYSHLGGRQILQVDYPKIFQEIHESIKAINDIKKNKVSKEKTSEGKMFYSPKELNNAFTQQFNSRGFHEIIDKYDIVIPNHDKVISNSYKQIDFVKDRVLIEVQFGKYAFMFYDLAKFQYFFNEGKADVGIEIVPCHNLQQQMSTGVSYGEQLVYDIERLKRHFPAVPVYVILVDIEE
ncbi:BglII/BstYI family type II restriction endonuclease [Candidatus Tisiphia endosymbiont of Empis tessellata]|uniref:BglII/BstYI family type II restriction endonuclease n=1 Tax=Candidatus Tisiphia endosymbiont of Empis tessellata TaxID=3066259 RepID=UPI00313C6740